jgi:hypothetical protein
MVLEQDKIMGQLVLDIVFRFSIGWLVSVATQERGNEENMTLT